MVPTLANGLLWTLWAVFSLRSAGFVSLLKIPSYPTHSSTQSPRHHHHLHLHPHAPPPTCPVQDVSTAVNSLGVTGLVATLALKNYAEDALGSLTLMTDKRFRIGDWIVFKGEIQVVQRVGLITTRLRLSSGTIRAGTHSQYFLSITTIVSIDLGLVRRVVRTIYRAQASKRVGSDTSSIELPSTPT